MVKTKQAKQPLKVARRRSKIHGNGVFALVPFRKGQRIIEYTGPLISHEQADEEYSGDIESGQN